MAWIDVVEQDKAEGKLKNVYDGIIKQRGKLSNIMKIHSLNPESMRLHMEFYLSIMFTKSGLTREEKELIAVVVSANNKCEYCINHHSEALNYYWNDQDKISKLVQNYKSIDFSERILSILNYANKLTVSPQLVSENDIIEIRNQGLTDQNILNINLIISYFNFVNRVAAGLGVEFSEEEMTGYKY